MSEKYIELTCEERIVEHHKGRIKALNEMIKNINECDINCDEERNILLEYHLSYTFIQHNKEQYWQYLLSWGGPSDEYRFHNNGKIEYRFHDWWDGAGIFLDGKDYDLLCLIKSIIE